MRFLFLGVVAFFLSNCHSSDGSLPYPLTITQEGMGSIHPGEPFDIALLRGKLPGFELEKLSRVASEKGATILQLTRGDKPIALIVSDQTGATLSEIIVLSPLVKNLHGLGINDTLPPAKDLNCTQEVCRYTNEPSILYTIDPNSRAIREIILQPL